MSKLKTKLRKQQVETLKTAIDELIVKAPADASDDDKLLYATLQEVSEKLYEKLGKFQTEYTISFKPAHAIALRLLYTGFVNEPTSYLGALLHPISNEVHKKYQS